MKVGRNAPCPCGSGRKHKQCCLNAATAPATESPEQRVWHRVRRALDGLPPVMFNFVNDVYGPEALHEAWAEFDRHGEDAAADFDPESPFIPVFMPWFFHRWAPAAGSDVADPSLQGRQPTAEYMRRRGRRLEPVLQRYLRACLAEPFSFYEILDTDPGLSFHARDVLTGEDRRVLECSASEPMRRGDILFAQLIDVDDIVMMEAGSPVLLPPSDKIEVMALREHAALRPDTASSREWLCELDGEIRDAYLRLACRILYPSPPEIHNTEGELIGPQRVVFDHDSEATDAELAEHPEVQAQVQQYLAAHYDEWVTSSLPALNGRTPLEAVADPEGREQVEALVTQFERDSGPLAADARIFQQLRERLGLSPSSDGAPGDA